MRTRGFALRAVDQRAGCGPQRHRSSRIVAIAILGLTSGSCVAQPPDGVFACTVDDECPYQQRCNDGVCRRHTKAAQARTAGAPASSGAQGGAESMPQGDPAVPLGDTAGSAAGLSVAGVAAIGGGTAIAGMGAISAQAGAGAGIMGSVAMIVGSKGESCAPLGTQICTNAPVGPEMLRCENGVWTPASCGNEYQAFCETAASTGAGSCFYITSSECEGKRPGEMVCVGKHVHICDSARSSRLDTCAGDTPQCQNSQCVCGTRCDDQCRSLQDDPSHCGACGYACETASVCSAGICQPRMVLDHGVNAFEVSAGFVYWIDRAAKSLMKASLTTWDVTSLAPAQGPSDIVVDSNVYWAEPQQGTISVVPINGGGTGSLVNGLVGPETLRADATSLYWVDNTTEALTIKRVSKTGGEPLTLATLGANSRGLGLEISGNSLYIADIGAGAIMHVPRSANTTQTPQQLASDKYYASDLKLDSNFLYFVSGDSKGNNAAAYRVPLDGGPQQMLGRAQGVYTPVMLYESYLYWGDRDSSENWRLVRQASTGQAPLQLLAAGHGGAGMSKIRSYDQYLYFSLGEKLYRSRLPAPSPQP